MSTILAPTRITFSTNDIDELLREAALKKHPELQNEEFEIQIVCDNSYAVDATAVVMVVT